MEDNFNNGIEDDTDSDSEFEKVSGDEIKYVSIPLRVALLSKIDRARKFIPRTQFLQAIINKAVAEKVDAKVMKDFNDYWSNS